MRRIDLITSLVRGQPNRITIETEQAKKAKFKWNTFRPSISCCRAQATAQRNRMSSKGRPSVGRVKVSPGNRNLVLCTLAVACHDEVPCGEPEDADDRFSCGVSRQLIWRQQVSALPRRCSWAPYRWITGCGAPGVVLVAIGCCLAEVTKPVDTRPVDGVALETPVPPPVSGGGFAASRPEKPEGGVSPANPLWSVPLTSLSITRERPLFSPSRRPPPPVVVAAPPVSPVQPPKPAVPDRPPLTLVGTAVGATLSVGVFVDQETKSVVRLRTGESHAGWTLQVINGREAILERDRRQVTLALPARNAADDAAGPVPLPTSIATRAGASKSVARPIPAQPPPVKEGTPRAVAPSSWLDGDGQIIGPPSSPSDHAEPKAGAASPSVWLDGDGQAVSAPGSPGTAVGAIVSPDNHGEQTRLAPTAWLDGDGQSISPPPHR